MIPKILHRVWLSYDGKSYNESLNERCKNAIKMQNECCKDFTIMEWGNECVDYYLEKYPMLKRYYCDVKNLAFCSDIIRLDVLYRYGGIYLDTDVEVFQPLNNEKLLNSRFFIGQECTDNDAPFSLYGHMVSNGIMGAEKGNKIIKSFLDVTTTFITQEHCADEEPMRRMAMFCKSHKHKIIETFEELQNVDVDECIPIFKAYNLDRANDERNTCDLKLFDHFFSFSWEKFLHQPRIPKTTHWCYLSNPIPELVEKCLKTWKKYCPDYTIKRWDLTNIDFNELPKWCKVAYENKLYAFVADYIRVKAVYEEGGIYLDSDVCLCVPNPFEDYAKNRLWIPMENVFSPYINAYQGIKYKHGIGVNPVFFGAEAGHPYLKELLDRYDSLSDNYPLLACKYQAPIAPSVWSSVMEKYGLQYKNEEQYLKHGIHVLTDEKFKHLGLAGDRKGLSALHIACNSWVQNKNKTY